MHVTSAERSRLAIEHFATSVVRQSSAVPATPALDRTLFERRRAVTIWPSRPACRRSGTRVEQPVLNDGEQPRRPGKVVLLVAAFWLVGTALQSAVRWLAEQVGVSDVEIASRVGSIVGWGLLFVLSVIYRHGIDAWLRR